MLVILLANMMVTIFINTDIILIYIHICSFFCIVELQRKLVRSEPILERKGMRVIFQKKDKIFENLGKNVQNLKIF